MVNDQAGGRRSSGRGGGGVWGGGDVGSGGGGGGVWGGGDIGSGGGGGGGGGGGDIGSGGGGGLLPIDSVGDSLLNGGVLHSGICSGVGLSMSMPCSLISFHNRSTSVQSRLGGVWPAIFVDPSSTGFNRFCNAAVPSSVASTSMRPLSFSRAATGAPNTKLTTWLTMKRIRRVQVTIVCRRICVGYMK
jgi:hypothetical protein